MDIIQDILAIWGVLSIIIMLGGKIIGVHDWIDGQDRMDIDIQARIEEQDAKMKSIEKEQSLIVHGVLACLKGLREQGCNGPVTNAIDEIEEHINKRAHGIK